MNERGRRNIKSGRKKSEQMRLAAEAERPWSFPVPLAEIPATGRRVELRADGATREARCQGGGVVALPRLEAVFDLAPLADDGVRVSGSVSATVEQNCVVTLETLLKKWRSKSISSWCSRVPCRRPRSRLGNRRRWGRDDLPDVAPRPCGRSRCCGHRISDSGN